MFQALIFDFDGLMVDTETPEVRLWQELYARFGQEFPLEEWVQSVVGATIANLDPLKRLEKLTGLPLDLAALDEEVRASRQVNQLQLPLLPGVREVLEDALLLGLRLAVASSSPREWVEGHLRRLGLLECFEALFCREDVAHLKPAPDLFLAALGALRLRPDQAFALEDSPNGITAASAAGLKVVGVPNGITSRLGVLRADLTLHSLAEMSLEEMMRRLGETIILRQETPGG